MKRAQVDRRRTMRLCAAALFAAVAVIATLTGISFAATAKSSAASGGSITVVMHYPSPPKYLLAEFTKETGIHVTWDTMAFADEQTKIAAAAEAHTYFADATDVDWSAIGEYAATGWFTPLNSYFNAAALKPDMPQIDSFVSSKGQLLGMPFDGEFITPTINTKDFAKAGIKQDPTTITALDADMKKLQASGFAHPLDIPFAAAAGEAQCWFQLTHDFGGSIVNKSFQPQFTSPSSPGYKALAWMVNAYKSGLVPAANINLIDLDALTKEMAHNRVAVAACDYSGDVASIYNVPSLSSVVNQVKYIPNPGLKGPASGLGNMDGIGIPAMAKNKAGAAEFIKWFDSTANQATWAGLVGDKGLIGGFTLPDRISSLTLLGQKKVLPAAQETALSSGLQSSPPMFPGFAPPGYVSFYQTTYDTIHSAAAGNITIPQAVATIAKAASAIASS
jgi:multiple sugar transport system substrate-binding protein